MKHYLKERLFLLLREEEIKWYERAKVNGVLESDDNTRFFHLVANGKHCKQHTFRLEQEDGVIVVDEELKSYITNYYKNLFGPQENTKISLVENRIDDISQVSEIENNLLASIFTEEEAKKAVFQMQHNKAQDRTDFLQNSIKFSGK